jgi:hypothetical protein
MELAIGEAIEIEPIPIAWTGKKVSPWANHGYYMHTLEKWLIPLELNYSRIRPFQNQSPSFLHITHYLVHYVVLTLLGDPVIGSLLQRFPIGDDCSLRMVVSNCIDSCGRPPRTFTHRHPSSFPIGEDWASYRCFYTCSARSETATRFLLASGLCCPLTLQTSINASFSHVQNLDCRPKKKKKKIVKEKERTQKTCKKLYIRIYWQHRQGLWPVTRQTRPLVMENAPRQTKPQLSWL